MKRKRLYDALCEEVSFVLSESILDKNIKIHGIEGRVKELQSIVKKVTARSVNISLDSIIDVVGLRVICLFREDINKISEIIRESFSVIDVDDKINKDDNIFGYMSVHYVCELNESYKGPRYQKIKNIPFEIQVRTLSMHAWAVMSHYLNYKGEWDVPTHLRKSLNALSALFYLADDQFAQFFEESVRSRDASRKPASKNEKTEINFDTLANYLSKKFPHRNSADKGDISELVLELKEAGYSSVEELNTDIDRISAAFEDYEKSKYDHNEHFASVGVVRISLAIASNNFISAYNRLRVGQYNADDFESVRKKYSIRP